MKLDTEKITEIWRKYEVGVDRHERAGLYESTAQAFRMYEGDQWHGLEGGEKLPCYNFIRPVVDYKTAMVAMQSVSIVYSPHDDSQPEAAEVCETLNRYAARCWESQKLDSRLWSAVRAACVAGDSYLYFYNSNLDSQLVDNTSVYLGDERQPEIQEQPYIIFYERRFVEDVRAEALENGVPEDLVDEIVPDEDPDFEAAGWKESPRDFESGAGGKCSCLLYMEKKGGCVHISRSTKTVVYQPDTAITGLKRYPVAAFTWLRGKNSARGIGEVRPLVQNQIEANRLLARRLVSAKMNAFAKPVYVENLVENPADIDKVGKAVKLRGAGSVQRVRDIFSYIAPAPMSAEASLLADEIIGRARELAGAGDAALGAVNPEKASGAAIIAVQDQAAIPLNERVAAYRQFIEDIALVWFDIWRAYERKAMAVSEVLPGGIVKVSKLSAEALGKIAVSVRVDASAATPFSRYAEEQALEVARNAGYISFEEYVEALPARSAAPKARLQAIVDRRVRDGE